MLLISHDLAGLWASVLCNREQSFRVPSEAQSRCRRPFLGCYRHERRPGDASADLRRPNLGVGGLFRAVAAQKGGRGRLPQTSMKPDPAVEGLFQASAIQKGLWNPFWTSEISFRPLRPRMEARRGFCVHPEVRSGPRRPPEASALLPGAEKETSWIGDRSSQAECPGGCRNGGFCNERHVCECPDGFYGPHCEKALCIPHCMNGGLCIIPGLCICPPGFYGINCNKANCTNICFNGGICFYSEKCICPAGLEGNQCEISKCHQPCRNGGKCTGKNKCKCSKGYQGDLCSKPVCEPSCGLYGICIEPNVCQCQDGWHGRNCNKRYGANLLNAMRPTGIKHRQQTPSPKQAEKSQGGPESNYVW